jgi:hypothetical protein
MVADAKGADSEIKVRLQDPFILKKLQVNLAG